MQIAVRELRKRYGHFVALDGLSFDVAPGERVALVGPNGSGKSTLNRALMGLLRYEGEVRLDGVSPREDRLDIARRVAYVPQTAPSLAAPVREVVRALAAVRGVPTTEVAAVAQRLDLDLEAVARRPVRDLSGGMKQKLLAALALSSGASLFILDEPTGSLDAETRRRFYPLLEERAGGATVILCSHRADELGGAATRVVALADGRIAHDGGAAVRGAAGSAVAPPPAAAALAEASAPPPPREGEGPASGHG